ncbi:unnamed protein product [Zymoseptoria tritici ST99CH_1E4]|uniref:Uncharacterized protein n=1 Tax=Zymoseptoria tritici ST99CH_1E4 TaxID=1276532 RepID=A0A2H1G5D1_ZYMTR|nr:unnamed protein product [Zymoseptoria tritici ST99CH_1E4]
MERRENVNQLKKVFYPSGTFLVSMVPVREADVLQPDTVSGDFRRPDGVVLVLVRDDMLAAFLTRSLRATDLHRSQESWAAIASSLISVLNPRIFERPGVVFVEEVLRDVCTYILQVDLAQKRETEQTSKDGEPQAQTPHSTDNLISQIVYIGCAHEDATLLRNAVTCARKRLQDDVIQQVHEMTLRRAVEPHNTFSERHRLLSSIQAIGDWIEAPEPWALESLAEVLELATTVDEDDGFTVYKVLRDSYMEEVVQQRILPVAQRLASTYGRLPASELQMPRNSDSDPYPEPVGSESGMANLLVTTVMYGLRLQSPEINATMLHQLAKAVKITPPTRLKSCKQPPAHGEDDVWIDRAGKFSAELRGLQQDILEQVLGEQYERLLKLRDVIVDWDRVPAILQISATTEGDQNIDPFAESGITSKRTAEGTMEWQHSPKRMAHTVDGLLEAD